LNTETKEYQHTGLDINTSLVGKGWNKEDRIPWSDCLIRCLQAIDSDYILYLQDDYFINDYVDHALISEFLQLMKKENVAHISLMYFDRKGVNKSSDIHPLLSEIKRNANYRISMQAALWNKDSLLEYLVSGETGWQFERMGSQRAHRKNDKFLCQNLDEFNAKDKFIVPYVATGIIKGKWLADAVVSLFEQHHIEIDFEKRGFFAPGPIKSQLIPLRAWLRRIYMHGTTWLPIK